MEGTRKTEAMQPSAMKKEDFAALWKSIHLKVTDTYDVPPEILWVNGSTIGTLGNFSASTGKAKSKKTFNISAIVAAALTNDEEDALFREVRTGGMATPEPGKDQGADRTGSAEVCP